MTATATKLDHKTALTNHEAALQKADEINGLLNKAQKDYASLQTASHMEDVSRAAELASKRAEKRELIDTYRAMLQTAQDRVRQAALDVLVFVADDYRTKEVAARKWVKDHDAKTNELLEALCKHTGSDAWRRGERAENGTVGGRIPTPEKRRKSDEAWRNGRSARFIEIVLEGSEGELLQALDDKHEYQIGLLLGSDANDPLDQGVGRRTTRAALPPELKPGGIYPLFTGVEGGE